MNEKFKNFVLPLICMVTAFLVCGTYLMTKPEIDRQAAEKTEEMRGQVLAGVSDFMSAEVRELPKGVSACEVYVTKEHHAAVTVTVKGYGGPLEVMVGILPDGTVSGVRVLTSSETPGVGRKTEEESFISQFVGKTGTEDVDSIAGASISSRAMKTAVAAACEIWTYLWEEE